MKEIEKTSKNIEQIGFENSEKVLTLSERVDEIILESVEVKRVSTRPPRYGEPPSVTVDHPARPQLVVV